MQYDVFISYTAEDEKLVEKITAYFEHYNLSCFFACRDLPAGIPWSQGIAEAVEQSRIALVVYSDNYNSASWLDDELSKIAESGNPIFVYALTNANYSEGKNDYLKNVPCVGAVGNIYDAFPYIYETACNILGQPIEPTQPAEVVLKDMLSEDAPQQTETTPQESPEAVSAPVEIEKPSVSVSEKQSAVARGNKGSSLLTAALIGISITAILILLLEWLLA